MSGRQADLRKIAQEAGFRLVGHTGRGHPVYMKGNARITVPGTPGAAQAPAELRAKIRRAAREQAEEGGGNGRG